MEKTPGRFITFNFFDEKLAMSHETKNVTNQGAVINLLS